LLEISLKGTNEVYEKFIDECIEMKQIIEELRNILIDEDTKTEGGEVQ
jgi:hypothetical protein